MSLDKVQGPDKEYVDWVTRIYSILRQGYYDLFCLKEIKRYLDCLAEEKKAVPDGSRAVLRHFIHLLNADLALCISKAYYDTTGTAMPIYKVAAYLDKKYKLPNLPIQPDTDENIYIRIKDIRDNYLAHNGKTIHDSSVELPELEIKLNQAKEDFNKIVIPELGFPYGELDDASIYSMKIQLNIGVAQLIESSYVLDSSDGRRTGKVNDHA